MAELIPIEYRLKTAQKQHLEKWMLIGVVTVGVSLASLTYTYMWGRQRSAERDILAAEFQAKSSTISQSQQLLQTRQELAKRMQKVEQLMDDKMLLSLLKNISDGFASTDCLEYISVDARGKPPEPVKDKEGNLVKDTQPVEDRYAVRITGITANNATLSDLVTRLSRQSTPPMNVVLESSRRENLLDGQVMRFQILCEKPGISAGNKGT
jgi:hypothetical protein